MGRVAYFTVGGCQVLKPCRGLVFFCFMYLVTLINTPNSKSLERVWSRGIVDRTKEYSFALSTMP